MNKILMVDSYKLSHYLGYDDNIDCMNYYIEARGGRWNRTVFFGLQIVLMNFFSKQFTQDELDEAVEITSLHNVPFNKEGWQYIIDEHNGYLPIKISAVNEGSLIPTSNVLVQINSTDPVCEWLPGHLETVLLRAVWYPTTVATQGFYLRSIISDFLKETGSDSPDFKLHDFGARSSKAPEAAGIGGAAHLVNFFGTDTLEGVMTVREFYDCKMPGFSIPALEHSVVMSYGRENEQKAYENFIIKNTTNIVAIVVDTYDLYYTIDEIIGNKMKDFIINCGKTIVIRPDSGNPIATVTTVINKLMDHFGYIVNEKGYKVLPPYIRVIHGDGISRESIQDIIFEMKSQKLSGDNITFGMGSKLLDQLDRDNLSFAMKCSAIRKNDEWISVQKDPKTDPNKRSKKGILSLVCNNKNECVTIEDTFTKAENDQLEDVFINGKIVKKYTFDEIRNRVSSYY